MAKGNLLAWDAVKLDLVNMGVTEMDERDICKQEVPGKSTLVMNNDIELKDN